MLITIIIMLIFCAIKSTATIPLLQLFYANTRNVKTAVEPGHTMSEYARNIVAQGVMKQ
jgi:hypothetical protein